MDLGEGFTKKSSNRCAIFLFSFQSTFESKLSTFLETKKPVEFDWLFLVAGEPQISNFLEGYEMVVELWLYMNRQDS
jgi:hypothetical protein